MADSIGEKTTCTFCDAAFESSEECRDHEVREHPMSHVSELERLLGTFQDSAEKAREVKQEKERLEENIGRLRSKQIKSEELIDALKETKKRLKEESQKKEKELRYRYNQLPDDESPVEEEDVSDETVEEVPDYGDEPGDDTAELTEEVELIDPHAPDEDDEPTVRAIEDEPLEDIDEDGIDLRNRITELKKKDKELRSAMSETDVVIRRLEQRSKE